MPEMGSGNGKEPCLVNHRVQITFRFLKAEDPGLGQPHLSRGGRAGLWPDLG